ncbi:MAG: AAA family ATPase [Novosphingobium sp.]
MPFVTMIAGPNGSGKSTLIARLIDSGVDLGEYLNADDIARRMAGGKAPTDDISRAAQIEVRERRQLALAEMRDHSFETVMSHVSHLDHLLAARTACFTVIIYFVATEDPVINSRRVADRVRHGGHDVPSDRIIARYHRCLANLPTAIVMADRGIIFDNSSTDSPLRPLAEMRSGLLEHVPGLTSLPTWWQEVLPTIGGKPHL